MNRNNALFVSEPTARQSGFTLIELLVVLTIIGLLGGLVGPQVMKHLSEAKSKSAKLQIEDFSTGLDMYKLDVGRYPTSDEGLVALVEEPANVMGWNGPYMRKKKIPKDPWQYDFRYRSPGEHGEFDLTSLGSDNSEGGEGEARDLASWE
ncbi:MAG: type II secretion system major pseudopilin GspG [Methylococcales bacterium]|nr:type II secretion system major pseudopilin GspG [Methylococcales bacterium]